MKRVARVALSLLASCAAGEAQREDVNRALAAADELERAHADQAAVEQLRAIAPFVDRDLAASLELRACGLVARAGMDPARACYSALAQRTDVPHELAAQARLRSIDSLEGDARRSALAELVRALPETDAARAALHELAASCADDRCGPCLDTRDSWVNELVGRAAQATDSTQRERIEHLVAISVVAWARELRRCEAKDRAITALERLRPLTDRTSQGDNARLLAAELLVAVGRASDAVELLSWLVHPPEDSPLERLASRRGHAEALLGRARAYEAGGDPAKALADYALLIDEHPDSLLVDDARFAVARLALARGERRLLERFIVDYPDSRHVGEARRLLGAP